MKALVSTATKKTERVFLVGVELKSRPAWDVRDSLDELATNLTAAFEAAAKGQLESVLKALEGVRTRLVAMLQQQAGDEIGEPASSTESPARPTETASPEIPAEDSSVPSTPLANRKRGQLF